MGRMETVIKDGCKVTLKYSDVNNPDALSEMRALLVMQKISIRKELIFDDNDSKCDNNDRK